MKKITWLYLELRIAEFCTQKSQTQKSSRSDYDNGVSTEKSFGGFCTLDKFREFFVDTAHNKNLLTYFKLLGRNIFVRTQHPKLITMAPACRHTTTKCITKQTRWSSEICALTHTEFAY